MVKQPSKQDHDLPIDKKFVNAFNPTERIVNLPSTKSQAKPKFDMGDELGGPAI